MTEQTQTYNGWTNYATWGVALVLDNDEWTYHEVREQANERGLSQHELADWLRDYTEELCGLEGPNAELGVPEPSLMARQVIAAGLADVNWDEIAAYVLSE